MALSASEPVAEIVSTSNTTSYSTGNFSITAGDTIFVMLFASGTLSTGLSSGMTGGNCNWYLEQTIAFTAAHTCYLYRGFCTGSSASTSLTFSCTDDAATGCMGFFLKVTGLNYFRPIRQYATAIATTTTPGVSGLAATDTNNAYWMSYWTGTTETTISAPNVSWTMIANNVTYNTPTTFGSSAFRVNSETGTSYSFTQDTSGNARSMFIEINEASVGDQPVDLHGGGGFFGG